MLWGCYRGYMYILEGIVLGIGMLKIGGGYRGGHILRWSILGVILRWCICGVHIGLKLVYLQWCLYIVIGVFRV